MNDAHNWMLEFNHRCDWNDHDDEYLPELMTALDNAEISSTQGWEAEETIWRWPDGSTVKIKNTDVLVSR